MKYKYIGYNREKFVGLLGKKESMFYSIGFCNTLKNKWNTKDIYKGECNCREFIHAIKIYLNSKTENWKLINGECYLKVILVNGSAHLKDVPILHYKK